MKAQKAAQAKKNEQKRQAAFKQLQDQVRQQGGQATPQQQQMAQQLQQSQAKENQEMQKLDQVLGPTDPQLLQQAMSNPQAFQQQSGSGAALPHNATYMGYIIDPQTRQPTHMVTFTPISPQQAAALSQGGGAQQPQATGSAGGQNPLGGLTGGLTGDGGPLGAVSGLAGGLLGGGQGLNVGGLLAIGKFTITQPRAPCKSRTYQANSLFLAGSDEKALLDLNPAVKKEDRIKQAQKLQQEQQIQQQQFKALKDQVQRQNGQATQEQQQQWQTIQRREAALKQAAGKLTQADQAAQMYGW